MQISVRGLNSCLMFSFTLVVAGAVSAQGDQSPWKVRAKLSLGRNPHQIAFDAVGGTAWVALSGEDQVVAIDTSTFAVKQRIKCDGAPLGVVAGPDGALWASRFRGKNLVRIDSGSPEKAEVLTGAGPSTLVGPLPSGHFLVSAEGDSQLREVDLVAGRELHRFATGKRPFPPGVTSDGRLAFVPDHDDGTLTVVDLWNRKVVKTLPVGNRPTGAVVLPGDLLCAVVLRGEDRLALVNTSSKSIVGHVKSGVGKSPFSGIVHQRGRLLFVNDTADARISVLGLPGCTPVTRLEVGKGPILMALNPAGDSLWISCEGSHEVWVLAIPERYWRDPVARGSGPTTSVAVMGMIHGRHRTSQSWGLARVEEAIRRFKPDVVCTEIPPGRWERVRRDYAERGVFEDSRIKPFPEYTECLLPLQKELRFVIEPCAGWTTEMATLRRARMKEFRTSERLASRRAEYDRRTREAGGDSSVGESDDPLVIHSAVYDAAIKAELSVYDEMLNDFIGPGGWTNINRAHMRLVHAAIDRHQGKRVLVTFGAGHKYWFLEDLARRKGVRLVDLRPYLSESKDPAGLPKKRNQKPVPERCKQEVIELHEFFQNWFNGVLPNTDEAFSPLETALGPDFEIISPEGLRTGRPGLLKQLRKAWRAPAKSSRVRIWIENVSVRSLGQELWLVTYEEWQQRDDERKGRLSSAVLQESPSGLLWLHVHETWLR